MLIVTDIQIRYSSLITIVSKSEDRELANHYSMLPTTRLGVGDMTDTHNEDAATMDSDSITLEGDTDASEQVEFEEEEEEEEDYDNMDVDTYEELAMYFKRQAYYRNAAFFTNIFEGRLGEDEDDALVVGTTRRCFHGTIGGANTPGTSPGTSPHRTEYDKRDALHLSALLPGGSTCLSAVRCLLFQDHRCRRERGPWRRCTAKHPVRYSLQTLEQVA